MEIAEYRNIFKNEEAHFFYASTHSLVLRLIEKYAPKRRLRILDAGCGTGGLLKKMSRLGDAVGIDFSGEAVKFAKKRGLKVKKASVLKIPFPKDSFDVVTNIDVIYHSAVTDDVAAIKDIQRVLKSDGVLILRVPANKCLMSAHDRHVHTARRYAKAELAAKLRRAGMTIKFISYVHSLLFPLSLVRVFLGNLSDKPTASSVGKVNPTINTILTKILKFEAEQLVKGVEIPFGQGLLAVASPSRRSSLGQRRR